MFPNLALRFVGPELPCLPWGFHNRGSDLLWMNFPLEVCMFCDEQVIGGVPASTDAEHAKPEL